MNYVVIESKVFCNRLFNKNLRFAEILFESVIAVRALLSFVVWHFSFHEVFQWRLFLHFKLKFFSGITSKEKKKPDETWIELQKTVRLNFYLSCSGLVKMSRFWAR